MAEARSMPLTPPGKAAGGEPWRVVGRTVASHWKVWLWRTFAIGLLGFIYINVLVRGITNSFPDFGEKLSKTPFMASLARYEETRRLQVAHAFALLFMVIVFVTWEILVQTLFGDDGFFERFRKPDVAKRLMFAIGAAVLAVDAWFYYSGITNSSWGGATLSAQALLATVGFVAVNAAATVFSVFLCPAESRTQPKEKSHA